MALVVGLEPEDRDFKSLHPTQVVCKYMIHEESGKKILQLNTYGSADRDVPGKLSQTLQFDEDSAAQLAGLLAKEFNHG